MIFALTPNWFKNTLMILGVIWLIGFSILLVQKYGAK